MVGCKVCVPHCRGDGAVTQQLLDGTEIDPVHHPLGRSEVPKIVEAHSFQIRRFPPLVERTSGISPAAFPIRPHKHVRAAHHPDKRLQPLKSKSRKRDIARLSALGVLNSQNPLPAVDVSPLEMDGCVAKIEEKTRSEWNSGTQL